MNDKELIDRMLVQPGFKDSLIDKIGEILSWKVDRDCDLITFFGKLNCSFKLSLIEKSFLEIDREIERAKEISFE